MRRKWKRERVTENRVMEAGEKRRNRVVEAGGGGGGGSRWRLGGKRKVEESGT